MFKPVIEIDKRVYGKLNCNYCFENVELIDKRYFSAKIHLKPLEINSMSFY